jgi:hypothetical protein
VLAFSDDKFAIDAEAPPPNLGGRDQWRSDDVKGLAGSSRITSSEV